MSVCLSLITRILHKKDQPLEVGKTYWELRESIVNCELLLIRFLKYNPKVTLPHKYLVHYLKSLRDWMDADVWNTVPLCSTAWAMLRDSYHCDICLKTKPQHLAVSVMYFTMQCYGVEVPLNDQAKVPWWKVSEFSKIFSAQFSDKRFFNLLNERSTNPSSRLLADHEGPMPIYVVAALAWESLSFCQLL